MEPLLFFFYKYKSIFGRQRLRILIAQPIKFFYVLWLLNPVLGHIANHLASRHFGFCGLHLYLIIFILSKNTGHKAVGARQIRFNCSAVLPGCQIDNDRIPDGIVKFSSPKLIQIFFSACGKLCLHLKTVGRHPVAGL